ncbi:mitochondrial ATPase inhibitor, IATP-domain-containing protein [Exophiala viscosa]|uniref:mitochondrial ATPase inhibitor, IATP-domain-containing protein n=1 Tax=Exophiala viscosa TaxID=2486360 RepID=UPI00218F2DA3|nr:mitochondrial ATPase inhibitor, IATP-domain-containing protein [Exophiala viscosa]
MSRITTPAFCQSFVTSHPIRAEGDTGAMRSGGVAAGDSFIRREQAMENVWVRQHEVENIQKMRERLEAQRKQLDQFESHLEEMEKAAKVRQETAPSQ